MPALGYAQHFTPLCAVDLMYDIVEELHGPLCSPRTIDPACGEGVLLQRAIERGITGADCVYGVERDPALALRALAPKGLQVAAADALLGLQWPAAGPGFDLVVANPPYGTGAAGLRGLSDGEARHIASAYQLWAVPGSCRENRGKTAPRVPFERVRTYPAEVLFLELCVRLARAGGHVAILIPEGIAANARYRRVRERMLAALQIDAVVGLPRGTFRRTGATAKAVLLVLTNIPPKPGHRILLGEVENWPKARGHGRTPFAFATWQPQSNPNLARRLDPSYWHPECDAVLAACTVPLVPLGGFISELTYGPIVTGRKPPREPEGAAIVNQGQVRFCGVDLTDAPRVPLDSPWVSSRAMLQPRDIVLPRSGEGSLRRHKVAVFLGTGPACVGSFVDLIRLRDLNPFYVAAFLKSRLGRAQVSRVANGVGVPNISFDEIRALLIPSIARDRQEAIEAAYRRDVLPCHRQALDRHAQVRRLGGSGRRDAELRQLREDGQRRWQAIIDGLDKELLGPVAQP